MYEKKYKIRMHDTDAAGVIFFANQFRIIHEAYEECIDKLGFGFGKMMEKAKVFLPIVHAEADYKKPLKIGDVITITLSVVHIGESSFTITYALEKTGLFSRTLVGTAKTVHVSVDATTKEKIYLPPLIRQALERHYNVSE